MIVFETKVPFFQFFCRAGVWCLRPLAVPVEVLLHRRPGERYPGFAAWVGLMLMLAWCQFGAAGGTGLTHLFMLGVVARLAVLRAVSVAARVRGDAVVPSRDPGEPRLADLFPRVPATLAPWLEPVAVVLASMAVGAVSGSLGDYLFWSGVALLGTHALRAAAARSRRLDEVDAEVARGERPRFVAGRHGASRQLEVPWAALRLPDAQPDAPLFAAATAPAADR